MARNSSAQRYFAQRDPGRVTRACDHPDCAEEGVFPAPRDRQHLREYRFFCLAHIRAYNAAWDFFAGLGADDIERVVRDDTVWNRPTWRMSGGGRSQAFRDRRGGFEGVADPFGVFSEGGPAEGAGTQGSGPPVGTPEWRALKTMGLHPPVTLDIVKARYKSLVKLHHPDANGGDRQAEERLKSINEAYTVLKRFLS